MTIPRLRLLAAALILTALTGATTRGCAGESGTTPEQAHGYHHIRLIAEGSPRRAHIYVKVGSVVLVDEARNLPWQMRNVRVAPHQFVEFQVLVIDVNSYDFVTCKVYAADGREIAKDGPKVQVDCGLAPPGRGGID